MYPPAALESGGAKGSQTPHATRRPTRKGRAREKMFMSHTPYTIDSIWKNCIHKTRPKSTRFLAKEAVRNHKTIAFFEAACSAFFTLSHPHVSRPGSNGLARSSCLGSTRTA